MLLLLLCASIGTFVYSVCACSRTYGASSRELGERHALCDVLLSLLLLQLRLLRLLRALLRTAAAAGAGAGAVCCHGFLKSVSRRRQIITTKSNGLAGRVFASGPVEQGFESSWGRVLRGFFPLSLFCLHQNPYDFFRFSDICSLLVWSDSVRTAAAVVIMYRFSAVPHVLYSSSSTIDNVLFTEVGRQMSGFEPSLPCFCVRIFPFFSFFFWWVSGLMGV